MSRRLASGLSSFLMASSTGGFALAQDTLPRAPAHPNPPSSALVEVVRDREDFQVERDGAYTVHEEKVMRILNQQGLEALKQATIGYSDGAQDGSLLEAYTIKANGTRIDVANGQFTVSMGASSAPAFQAMKVKVALFQNVEVGDEVGWAIQLKQKVPWFAGRFSTMLAFPSTLPVHDTQISISAPQSLGLHTDTLGLGGGETSKPGDDVQHWVWTYTNDTLRKPEPNAVSPFDSGPYLVVSSFPDFAAIGKAYQDGAAEKIAITPDIQTLADHLTDGISDRREQARKLYNWVSGNIKYIAIVLGNGGIVPHNAAEVLHNRYGDCKDHVVLLQALLAAKSITSSGALINAGNAYKLGAVAAPEIFNHIITYIPEFNLFADSTARFVAFGSLPFADTGKNVVITTSGDSARTPVLAANDSSLRSVSYVTLKADGGGTGNTTVVATGEFATDLRAGFSAIVPNTESDFVRTSVEGGATGGTMTRDDALQLADPYHVSMQYTLANAASFPGPAAMSLWLGYHPLSFTSTVGDIGMTRTTDYVCGSLMAENDSTIVLPPKTSIISLPKTGSLSLEGLTLSVTYSRINSQTVKQDVTVRQDHPQPVCTAAYYNAMQSRLAQATKLLSGQLLYK